MKKSNILSAISSIFAAIAFIMMFLPAFSVGAKGAVESVTGMDLAFGGASDFLP